MKRLLLGLALCLLGLFSFYIGFFLTRVELKNQATCTTSSGPVCNFPAQYSKCILIVIDALRLDFVLPEKLDYLHPGGRANDKAPVYLNKLLTLRDLLVEQPNHTFISRFDADPPTTTMQRLKGLTVGGLPTFIDIKDDVASEAISEDNIISQLNSRGKRVTFMGDDTWVKLFPREMNRQFPFDSFNVKDLDTLDNGVLKHLLPEMGRGDWDLLIAHFLGVDHAGHRYGPNHAEMTRKLIQMDEVLAVVIREMPRDALLLVAGDHGMTEDGNHGGASLEERSTAIFAYSPGKPLKTRDTSKPVLQSGEEGEEEAFIQQVDLASTLALLLDFPIPFGNLGFFIPELFVTVPRQELIARAKLNTRQIWTYFKTYDSREIVDAQILDEMERLMEAEEEDGNDWQLFHKLQAVSRKAVEAARQQWTQFDMRFMLFGIASGLLGLALLFHYSLVNNHAPGQVYSWGMSLAWLLSLLALTSNSYIDAEANVAVFCLHTLLLLDTKPSKHTLLRMVALRLALPLGALTRRSGHEFVPSLHLAPVTILLVLFLHRFHWRASLVLQAAFCLGYYLASSTAVWWLPIAQANLLAQCSFLLLFPLAVWRARDLEEMLCSGVIPLAMILGPTGGLPAIALFAYLAHGCAVHARKTDSFWIGVALALISQVVFFASGHLCDFSALRMTAPYVGFEAFNYYRGVIMLSLDTFSAHLIGVCLARLLGGRRGMAAFLLVYATRGITTMLFVCFARRHLMVWAIFAPKFIFDSAALLACCVFAVCLEALCALKRFPVEHGRAKSKEGAKWL